MEKLLAHENIRIINTQTIDYLLSMMLFDQNQYSMQQHNLKPGNLFAYDRGAFYMNP